MKPDELKKVVREKYGEAARQVSSGTRGSCCGGGVSCSDPITSDLYAAEQTREVPAEALQASLGCGNPTALATLVPGEVVLDLGSGGGIDVLLSARRVGPKGKAYGLDMTDEMLALARENQRKAGVTNAEFLSRVLDLSQRAHEIYRRDADNFNRRKLVDMMVSKVVISKGGAVSNLREPFSTLSKLAVAAKSGNGRPSWLGR